MNHAFRLVFNTTFNAWVAVPECARTRGRGGRLKRSAAALALCSLLAPLALAAPSGGAISAGSGSISQSGTNTTINQSSQNLAINWQSFSIAANETVRFNQPNSSAIALNRVLGQEASQILGSLSANGQVFIINPNGVLFANGAQVNVGGLVASTLGLSDADFMVGNYSFSGSGGSVVNQGQLTAADGGYIALLGPTAKNEGVIVARLGSALIGAGNKITLTLLDGSLLHYNIDAGAIGALAKNSGLIRVDGGTAILSARAANSLTSAVVNNTGIIEARTVANQGGVIKLLGDMAYGTTQVAGRLDASAPDGGDGGFVETSAAQVRIASDTIVTTLATSGANGTWLIDPGNFTIGSGSAPSSTSGIGADTLATNLANGNVTLQTAASGSEAGDLNVNAAVSWTADTTLTLSAAHDINVNAELTASGTHAGLVLNYGNAYNINAPVTLSGNNASLAINGQAYTLIHNLTDLDNINNDLGGHYALAGDLDAGATSYTQAVVGSDANAFTGTFAGLGHHLDNLTIDALGGDYVGLFARNEGSLRDFTLSNIAFSGGSYVGGVVGYNSGTISKVSVSGSVDAGRPFNSGEYAGGVAGYNDGSISDVTASVSVTGHHGNDEFSRFDYVGGLAGYNNGEISRSAASGDVSGSDQVGGLVGSNDSSGNISHSHASGTIADGWNAGGLAGSNDGNISDSYASGEVNGGYAGGLVGNNSGLISSSYAIGNVHGSQDTGGLAGRSDGSISNSYASGAVDTSDDGQYSGIGGLVGTANGGSIINAYATGNVSGTRNVGGLVGRSSNTTITNTYASGNISGASNIGALIGNNGYLSRIVASFWLSSISSQGIGNTDGGTIDNLSRALGASQSTTLATYTQAGWNIDDAGSTGAVWRLYGGLALPLLRSFLTPLTVTAGNDGTSLSYSTTPNNNLLGTASIVAGQLGGLYSNQQGYDISYVNPVTKPTPTNQDTVYASAIRAAELVDKPEPPLPPVLLIVKNGGLTLPHADGPDDIEEQRFNLNIRYR